VFVERHLTKESAREREREKREYGRERQTLGSQVKRVSIVHERAAVCFSVLWCVAVCCRVLQRVLCVAVCCNVLQFVVVCRSVLQCVAMCCSVCCGVLQYVAVCCRNLHSC